ncbi:MAG: tetratricopeptide repeat protein [Sulfurovum sp.]
MGTIEQKLIDYIWKHIELLEAIFSEKIYKILVRFKDKEDIESFSDTVEAVIEVDNELLEKLKTVFKSYDNRIEDKIELDEVYHNIGKDYHNNKEYDKAMEYYQKALKINSKKDKSYYNIGLIYFHRKDYDKAMEYYQEAIEINPKNSVAYNNMGIIYKNKNEYDKAIKYYQKSIKLKLNYSAFYNLNISMNDLNKAFFLDKKISNLNLFIDKIQIQNFKQYRDFSIDFSKQINIIIGQNAIGKTTLLQAITLGLLKENSTDARKVEYETYVPEKKEKSELIIYHNNEEKKVEIFKNKRKIEENYFIPFVLAYGSNFFTSSNNKVQDVAEAIVSETIHKDFTSSIFVDFTSGFVNPIQLLQFLDLEKDKKVPDIQNTFIDTINSFLEGFTLVAKDKNYYFQKDGADTKLRLEDLSEGYRGNVLLITDMLIKILGVGYTPETIEGIVLIDEFDKHLHPKWQSRLVNQLRDTFPKIQFIMTTHNPMSILGRNPDEITILKEVEGKIIAEKGQGTEEMDVSNVLLEYFDVDSVVGKPMQDKIKRFNELRVNDDTNNNEYKRLKNEILNSQFGVLTIDSDYLEYLKSKKINNPPKNRNFDNIGDFL